MAVFLFDLDGTLTDPYDGIANCMQYTLEQFGITVDSPAVLRSYIGPPIFENFLNAGIKADQCKEALSIFDEKYLSKGIFENSLYDGIIDMLMQLKKKNMITAIASSKAQEYVLKIATHFGIHVFFDYIGGSNLDGTGSDKAVVIEHVLSKLNVHQRDHVYLIGDRDFDISGAKKVGIKSIAVRYGYGSEEELASGTPEYIVSTVKELTQLLMELSTGI